MNKNAIIATLAVALAICLSAAIALVPSDETDGVRDYGAEDDVGAKTVSFKSPTGDTTYFTQRVISGNTFYFPTEKAPDTSDAGYYDSISRSGYALAGWSEVMESDSGTARPVIYPGSAGTATRSIDYYAVWVPLEYDCQNVGTTMKIAQHIVTAKGSDVTLDTTSDGIRDLIEAMVTNTMSSSKGKFVLEVTRNGQTQTGDVEVQNLGSNDVTSVAGAGGFSFQIVRGAAHVWGTAPSEPGHCSVRLTHLDYNGRTGAFTEDYSAMWLVTAYDPATDPSNIRFLEYSQDGASYLRYGPIGTAVKLPARMTEYQIGWHAYVDGSSVYYPIGGSYTLTLDLQSIDVEEYSSTQIMSIAGVIALDCVGGQHDGHIAAVADPKGFAAIPSSTDGGGHLAPSTTKDGFTLLGWNESGLASDPLYPDGYLYDMGGRKYVELRAVWAEGDVQTSVVEFKAADLSTDATYRVADGRAYATPVHGFDVPGWALAGWSTERSQVGEGTATVTDTFVAGSALTYYPVYRQASLTLTVYYNPNNNPSEGTGSEFSKTYTSLGPGYATVLGCPDSFTYQGKEFAGWSKYRTASAPSYQPGYQLPISKAEETIYLYAVWTDSHQPSGDAYLFTVSFVADGADVNPMAPLRAESESRTHTFTVPLATPSRAGFDFLGWTSAEVPSTAMPGYDPGRSFTLEVGEGETAASLTLRAVWSQRTPGGDGDTATVLFRSGGITVFEQILPVGGKLSSIPTNAADGHALMGWYTELGRPWNFDEDAVEGDMVLNARFIHLFSLDVEEDSVRVVMKQTYTSATVAYPDGTVEEHSVGSIPAHHVEPGSKGTVSVTATTEVGTFTAVHRFAAQPDGGDGAQQDMTLYYAAGAAVAVAALLLVARWFL